MKIIFFLFVFHFGWSFFVDSYHIKDSCFLLLLFLSFIWIFVQFSFFLSKLFRLCYLLMRNARDFKWYIIINAGRKVEWNNKYEFNSMRLEMFFFRWSCCCCCCEHVNQIKFNRHEDRNSLFFFARWSSKCVEKLTNLKKARRFCLVCFIFFSCWFSIPDINLAEEL